MFTISKNYFNKFRSHNAKEFKTKPVRYSLAPFKPSFINIYFFAKHRDCLQIITENKWLEDVKLYENPLLVDELVKADFETLTIELSSEVMQEDLIFQRDIFIRVVCQFIAQCVFHDCDIEGQPYKLLVERYSKHTLPATVKEILYKSKH